MQVRKIVLSVLMLLNVLFVPLYDVWSGLFPERPMFNFIDVMELVFDGEFDLWPVTLTLVLLIPAIFMLAFSFSKSNGGFKISAGVGAVAMMIILCRYVEQFDLEDLFDFDYGNIAIGTWIGLILLIISLFAVKIDYAKSNPSSDNYIYCQYCGNQNPKDYSFCSSCGKDLKN